MCKFNENVMFDADFKLLLLCSMAMRKKVFDFINEFLINSITARWKLWFCQLKLEQTFYLNEAFPDYFQIT